VHSNVDEIRCNEGMMFQVAIARLTVRGLFSTLGLSL